MSTRARRRKEPEPPGVEEEVDVSGGEPDPPYRPLFPLCSVRGLGTLLQQAGGHATLTPWEREFLTDIGRLFGQYGGGLRLTARQCRRLNSLWEKTRPGAM